MMATLPARKQAVQIARQVIQLNPVYLDTETTGISQTDEIVEIAIIDYEGSCLYDSLVKPTQTIDLDTQSIHHISNEMVEKAPIWPFIWPVVRSILANRVIAIYNAEFDMRMLRQTMARYNQPWRETFKPFCIMKLYAQFHGEWDRKKNSYRYISLDQAGKQCGISLPNAHRGLADTLLAREILIHISQQE